MDKVREAISVAQKVVCTDKQRGHRSPPLSSSTYKLSSLLAHRKHLEKRGAEEYISVGEPKLRIHQKVRYIDEANLKN